jgi:chromate reductase
MLEAKRVFDPAEFDDADLRLPLYDGDLEDRTRHPGGGAGLADQIASADAVIIAGPEYNKALSGVLKNALDWVSRTQGQSVAGQAGCDHVGHGGRAGGERTQFPAALHDAVPRARPAGARGSGR